jgi:hypothetical protein
MKRYFSTEDRDETKLVKVKALKRGTLSGKFGSFHMDPKGKDPLARARSVRPEVAAELEKKGLAKIEGRGSRRTSGFSEERLIDNVAARRRETSITGNDEDTRFAEVFGSNGADTRDTTAFEVDPSKTARVSPFETVTLGEADVDDDDDDGQEDDDGDEEAQTTRDPVSTSTGPADDAMLQEGNAGGADSPPRDDDEQPAGGTTSTAAQAGSDQGATDALTDATGAPIGVAGTETPAVVDPTAAPIADAPAPRPRRGSRAGTTAA